MKKKNSLKSNTNRTKSKQKYIIRRGAKNKYYFIDKKNKIIKEKKIVDYAKSIYIPPAWTNVKIYLSKNAEPIATGFDKNGRQQSIYSNRWITKRSKKKICGLQILSKKYSDINKKIDQLLKQKTFTKNKVIALILKIVIHCNFRLGNNKYKKLYNSYGTTNLMKDHITVRSSKMINITFNGKKGVINSCDITEPLIIANLNKLYKQAANKKSPIFTYFSDDNNLRTVSADDVNVFLKSFDENITSKDIRTYNANIYYLNRIIAYSENSKMNPVKLNKTQRTKISNGIVEMVANNLHHTKAVCKKSYIDKNMIDMYINYPKKFHIMFIKKDEGVDKLFEQYLRSKC